MIGSDRATLHRLDPGPTVGSRNEELLRLASGRRVVHLGCTDSPFMAQMVANGTLFHAQLAEVTHALLGVDIDEPGLKELDQLVPGDYLAGDVSNAEVAAQVAAFAPELVIAADVIEHVPDAVPFLRGLRAVAEESPRPCLIILTTPNGLAIRPVTQTPFRIEVMHPDHVALYTPTIMRTVVERAGLTLRGVAYYNNRHTRDVAPSAATYAVTQLSDGLVRVAAAARPQLSDGMIVACSTTPLG